MYMYTYSKNYETMTKGLKTASNVKGKVQCGVESHTKSSYL